MELDRLELFNFRNYRDQRIDFSPTRNLVMGRNAQGKTNLLESIYSLCYMRSSRTSRTKDLILLGENGSTVTGTVRDGSSLITVKLSLSGRGREVTVNGRKIESVARARGLVKCVLFSPEDLYLVKGEPSRRRDFMNETLEGIGPARAEILRSYRRVLRQRNALLKEWDRYGERIDSVLEPWTEGLVREGGKIVVERTRMVRRMAPLVGELYQEVAGEEKKVEFLYQCGSEAGGESLEEVETALRAELAAKADEERKTRVTTVGPHRDDIKLVLDGREARFQASQGEQRTMALCMRLAQKGYLEEETGKIPILLLDDVLSELDADRGRRVVDLAGRGSQVIITTTELHGDTIPEDTRILLVAGGSVDVA